MLKNDLIEPYIISIYGIADGVKRWRKYLTKEEFEVFNKIITCDKNDIIPSGENTIQGITIKKDKLCLSK